MAELDTYDFGMTAAQITALKRTWLRERLRLALEGNPPVMADYALSRAVDALGSADAVQTVRRAKWIYERLARIAQRSA